MTDRSDSGPADGCVPDILGDPSATRQMALAAAAERFRAAGVADPARDAHVLLAHVAGVSEAAVRLDGAARMGDAAVPFAAAARARVARQPVSQIIGRRAFYAHDFIVTPDVLDPRPESEAVVDAALTALSADATGLVIDLGVGSGCLLLSVLAARPRMTGIGVDASPAALAVAARNAVALGLSERTDFQQGDWEAGVPAATPLARLLLCNPPYIALEDWQWLAPEVRGHEPKAALTPGADGLSVYRRLAHAAPGLLADDGLALFEVGRGQAPAVAALMAAAGAETRIKKDLGGVSRVVVAFGRDWRGDAHRTCDP